MTTQKRTYLPEFKQEAILLWKSSGKSASAIEIELGITQGLLSRWKRKQDFWLFEMFGWLQAQKMCPWH